MKKLPTALFLLVAALIASCSTGPSQEERFARTLHELKMADVTQWPNSILVGNMFPSGKTHPISDNQARRLQWILLEARAAKENPTNSKRTISPAPRLCALSLARQTWYFMPVGHPVSFVLPAPLQEEFERMMRVDFGLKD